MKKHKAQFPTLCLRMRLKKKIQNNLKQKKINNQKNEDQIRNKKNKRRFDIFGLKDAIEKKIQFHKRIKN